MMNVPNSCNEFSYVPPNPPALLPIMDQESAMQREQHLGFNLEANTNIHMAMANPLALLPSNTGHHATIGHASQDVLQFYPSSHYLGNPYGHFGAAGTSYQSYYPSAPAAPEYYFPTLASAGPAEDNLASFAATQLGLNLGYRTYFPPRGAYTYGHHPPRCQAEGCKADLSSAKRYHRRHKVCEHHSKAPVVVTSGGLHQRFCQQCSRFHLLDEFDDAKKSCRKRLADHNRRRRKSKPSDADGAADKRKTQANKATTRDKAGSSSKSISTVGDGLEQQVVGSSSMSKEQHQAMPGLAEVVKEVGDHKGKASMEEQTRHGSLRHHGHHAFSFPSSSGSGFLHPQSQAVSSDNTSNMAQEHEPSLALLQHHQHSNILQLGQAMFDLDFTS